MGGEGGGGGVECLLATWYTIVSFSSFPPAWNKTGCDGGGGGGGGGGGVECLLATWYTIVSSPPPPRVRGAQLAPYRGRCCSLSISAQSESWFSSRFNSCRPIGRGSSIPSGGLNT